MKTAVNVADRIKQQLPPELATFLQEAGETADHLGQRLYLVGGVVRDLLLHRTNVDLDLVAEGDAIKLAEELARLRKGRVIAHSRFNTAKVQWGKWTVDTACARAEGYEKPGALPNIQPCDIQSDLIRRDFTVNAMAVYLVPARYGELIDVYGGQADLAAKQIRILHDNTFRDDATRIWRAARYEQRLDFKIEPHTLGLIKRDVAYLETITGDRIRHELELCLEEDKPEKALLRAGELGVLARIHPPLRADDWLARRLARARGMLQPYCPPAELYLAFLVYRLTPAELAELAKSLNFSRPVVRDLEDTLALQEELPGLREPDLPPSRIYHALRRFSHSAILANLLATDMPLVRQRIELYLEKLSHVQPALTGEELKEMGLAAGPGIKKTLELLREAHLDGKVKTREEELELIRRSGDYPSP